MANAARDPVLISFCAAGISEHAISSSLQAVRALMEGMSVTCAKRRAKPVLELVPSESADSDPALAGMVLADLVLPVRFRPGMRR